MTSPQRSARHDDRRRTHAERTAETRQRLFDATIAAIADVGYRRATTTEICSRAGVTQGALFHHFDTRIELVLAALERMTQARIARYGAVAQRVEVAGGGPLELLRVVGQLARDRVAVVWAEVTVAARTDVALRQRLEPALQARWALIDAAASTFPALAQMEPPKRQVWFQVMRGTLELAPLIEPFSSVDASAVAAERRDRALLDLAGHLGARRPEA
jgi:AcrR family transcriptional regulator